MSSIFLTNKRDFDLGDVDRCIRLRGPDHTERLYRDGLTFVHNLPSTGGGFTDQPFHQEGVVALFSGEIYNHLNYGHFSSEGECVIPLYREYGALFPQALDGEFAVIAVDLFARCVILSTDIFATKPLHVAIDGENFAIASYESALRAAGFRDVLKVPANCIWRIDLDKPSIAEIGKVHEFSTTPYRSDVEGWIDAFERAVRKRVDRCPERVFIGLSSGYDSGAISLALNTIGHPYRAYSVLGDGRDDIVRRRMEIMAPDSHCKMILPDAPTLDRARHFIDLHVESPHQDVGAAGLSMVCEQARNDGCKVYLSGQGAEEIMSDPGFAGRRVLFHGRMEGPFPVKEEHVAGAYGMEARYPFLDRRVVQEFLALDHRAKNGRSLSALRTYLERNAFPTPETALGM